MTNITNNMQCTQCKSQFQHFPGEAEAYAKFDLPLPDNCPDCRQLRRLLFRNERNIYYKKSEMSGKKIMALYHEDSPFKVVDQSEWWTDEFDATQYGRDFDFNRPFFEQFAKLQKDVPRWSRIFLNCENCEYTNNCARGKNCYLAFSSNDGENLYNCVRVYNSKDVMDSLYSDHAELSSFIVNCKKTHNIHYSMWAENCSDSFFLFDCISCHDCILCANLRNKSYYILNKKYSKEDYEKFKVDFLRKLWNDFAGLEKQFEEMRRTVPHQAVINKRAENVTGDIISGCKNITNGYYCYESEDCINLYNSVIMKNCYDTFSMDESELLLECDTGYDLYNCKFCTYVGSSHNSQYCDQCFNLDDCFGCIGLKKQKHMILNKKYSPEQYKEMLAKIKEHMKKTGEYGKPFPASLSAFAYNETVANDQYALKKEEALAKGHRWFDKPEDNPIGEKQDFPTSPDQLDDSLTEKVFTCEKSGKPYKIIPMELRFYKRLGLPIPHLSPEQRYRKLNAQLNPQRLRDITCANCQKQIQTTYRKGAPYKIYCQECFLGEVY